MRTASQGTGRAGRRGRPSSPTWPRTQRVASCLLSSQTPRPSLADSTSEAAPSRVAAVPPWRTRYTAESSESQALSRQSRRETTTASSPTDSTWTERSPPAGRPVTDWMAPVSTSRTNGAGSLATSSRSPEAPRSGTPGSGWAAAWPSWPGREPAVPGRSQRSARATTIVAATSSTPSPAAIIMREETGRLGGRWSRCAALVMTPDTQSGRLGFPNLTITSAGHRLVEAPPARIEPATPSLPSMRRWFTTLCSTPRRHTTAQVGRRFQEWERGAA
jgi:hypothetical protein